MNVLNVLFICTDNSAQSIMAEGLLNKLGNGRFQAFSAGSHPAGQVHPFALERLELEGINPADARSKSWDEFARADAPVFDFVITVCDNAADVVRQTWPRQAITAHWEVFDPTAAEEKDQRIAFAKAFAMLERRIALFASLPMATLERMALEQQVRDIGTMD